MAWPSDNTAINVTDIADIPRALTYTHPSGPSGGTAIEVCSGPVLDVTRQTPWGTLTECQGIGGDGSDCWEAFQWALDNWMVADPTERDYEVGPRGTFSIHIGGNSTLDHTTFGHGLWRITQPLICRPGVKSHCPITGDGQGDAHNTQKAGGASRIYYEPASGYEDYPAIIIQSEDLQISRLAVLGLRHPNYSAREAIGVGISRINTSGHPWYVSGRSTVNSSVPTSNIRLDSCGIAGFTTCIQNGGQEGDNNNDFHHIENCHFDETECFFHNVNTNGVGLRFERNYGQVDAGECWYYFEGGGKARFQSEIPAQAGRTYLRIGNDTGRIGLNNFSFLLDDVSFDAQATNASLVEMEAQSGVGACGVIKVVGGTDSSATSGQNTAFMTLSGNVLVSIDGFKWPGLITCAKYTNGNDKVAQPFVDIPAASVYSNTELTDAEALAYLLAGDYTLGRFNPVHTGNDGGESSVSPRPLSNSDHPKWSQAQIEALARSEINDRAASDTSQIAAAGRPRSY